MARPAVRSGAVERMVRVGPWAYPAAAGVPGGGKKARSAAAISARTGAPEMITPAIVVDV